MHNGCLVGMFLLVGAAASAAEPPQRKAAKTVDKPATRVTAPGTTSPAPLKLRVGDVRKYMLPHEFAALVRAPDAEKNTVVVEGQRVLVPMKFEDPVPPGIIAPFWAIAHPTQAWRIFLPDPRAPEPGPPDVVPKPEFRRGP